MRAAFRHRGELCLENAKTPKGEKHGYLTAVLYFSPATTAGDVNMCPFSTPSCRRLCIHHTGRARVYAPIHEARRRRTLEYLEHPERYAAALALETARLEKRAKEHGLRLAVRTAGTHEADNFLEPYLADAFPRVQLYNYVKRPEPWRFVLPNYHLTFSLSGSRKNAEHAEAALAHGINVAVVFGVPRRAPLPSEYKGRRVIDGDLTDTRWLDPRGVYVGLRAKGEARSDPSPFVERRIFEA
jgi:hypothetical protein